MTSISSSHQVSAPLHLQVYIHVYILLLCLSVCAGSISRAVGGSYTEKFSGQLFFSLVRYAIDPYLPLENEDLLSSSSKMKPPPPSFLAGALSLSIGVEMAKDLVATALAPTIPNFLCCATSM